MLNNIIEEIDNKKKEIDNKKKEIIPYAFEFIFPKIGCNANCSYCFQYQGLEKKYINKDFDIAYAIEKKLNYFERLIKNKNLTVDELWIMGGELKILSLENQLKLIDLINKLKEKYKIVLFVNDTKLDSPLMKIEGITYIFHIINWKNKNILELDKQLNEKSIFLYKIVITDNDTEEEVTNFLDINKEIRDRIDFNLNNFDKKLDTINKFLKFGKKFIDFKHCIYKCKNYDTKLLSFSFEDDKTFFKRCCYEPEEKVNFVKDIDSILEKELPCKTCNDAINNTFFSFI